MGMIKSDFIEQVLESAEDKVASFRVITMARDKQTGDALVSFGVENPVTCGAESPLAWLFGFIEESADMGQGDILSFAGDKDNLRVIIRRDGQDLEYSKEDILAWTGDDDREFETILTSLLDRAAKECGSICLFWRGNGNLYLEDTSHGLEKLPASFEKFWDTFEGRFSFLDKGVDLEFSPDGAIYLWKDGRLIFHTYKELVL